MYKALSVAALLFAALAFVHHPAKAGGSGTSRGVTLIQLSCGEDPSVGGIGGSLKLILPGGDANCQQFERHHPAVPLLPSGTLYNLRVSIDTQNNSPSQLPLEYPVTVVSSSTQTELSCTIPTSNQGTCEDLTHQFGIGAGGDLQVTITIPTDGEIFSAVATLEEQIVE
jgi:hypothetical protein